MNGNTALLLQVINGYITVTALIGAMVFFKYIWENRGLGYKHIRPALAIFPVFVGVLIIYTPIFLIRTEANAHQVVYVPPVVSVVVGSLFIEAGFLCKIRVFTAWRGYWIGAVLISTLVVVASLLWVVSSGR